MRAPLAAVPATAVVPVLAGPNRGFGWCVGAADRSCWLGSYDLEKQEAHGGSRDWTVNIG